MTQDEEDLAMLRIAVEDLRRLFNRLIPHDSQARERSMAQARLDEAELWFNRAWWFVHRKEKSDAADNGGQC